MQSRALHTELMRIAKPLLLIATPLGVAQGVYECYRLAGGLVFIMICMLLVMSAAAATVVAAVRRERRESLPSVKGAP